MFSRCVANACRTVCGDSFFLTPGLLRVALDDVPERLARHAIATACRKQVVGLALEQDLHARAVHELFDPVLRFVAERNQPFAVALADDPEHALVQVDLTHLQIDELRHAHAGGVQHLEHRAVTVAERLRHRRSREQRLDFFFGQRLRQSAADLRHRDLRGRVLAEQTLRAADSGRNVGSSTTVARSSAASRPTPHARRCNRGRRRDSHERSSTLRDVSRWFSASKSARYAPSVFSDNPRSIQIASRKRSMSTFGSPGRLIPA